MAVLKYLLFLTVFKFAFQLDENADDLRYSSTIDEDDIDNISDGAENRVIPSESERIMTIDRNNNDGSAKKSEQAPDSVAQIGTIVDEMKQAGSLDPSTDNTEEMDQLKKFKRDMDSELKDMKDIKAGVELALPMLMQGFQTGNLKQVLVGAMKLATAILTVAKPFITGGGVILKMIAMATALLNGEPNQVDPLKNALENFQIEGLELDVKGIATYYGTLVKSVEKYSKKTIPKELGYVLYKSALEHVQIFGKLKELMELHCTEVQHTLENDKATVKKCLKLVNAYVEASTTRQLVLTRLASFLEMSELHDISQNFMDLVQAQREEDVEVLKCFADPLNSFREKLIVNEIFSNPHQYYLIWEYLLNLDEMYSDVIDNNHAVICTEEYLQGFCIQLKIEPTRRALPETQIKSLFVPKNINVDMFFDAKAFKKLGSFRGTAVYSSKTNFAPVKFIQIYGGMSDDAIDFVRLCTVDGWCDTVKYGNKRQLREINGVKLNSLKSVYVPPGYNIELKSSNGIKAGPIYGPFTINGLKACANSWETITVLADKTKTANKMVEVCGVNEVDGYCLQLEEHGTVNELNPPFWSSSTECKPNKNIALKIPIGSTVTVFRGIDKYGPFKGPAYYPKFDSTNVKITVQDLFDTKRKKARSGIMKRFSMKQL